MNPVLEDHAAFPHGHSICLSPFKFVDVHKIKKREHGFEAVDAGEGRDLETNGKAHYPGVTGRLHVGGVHDPVPDLFGGVHPYLVDKPHEP